MTARSTITRSRLALTVPVLALAVLGADTVAYAATGTSLVVGKTNRAEDPTVLKNTGKGPALTLKSKGRSPSLKVSSDTLVRKLNADRLDGQEAAELAPATHRISILRRGETLADARYFRVRLPAGEYLMTLNGLLEEGQKFCFVGNPELAREDDFLLGDQTEDFSVTATTVASLDGGDLLVGCTATDGPVEAFSAVTVTFRQVAGVQTLPATPVPDPFSNVGARGRGLDLVQAGS